LLIVGEPRGGSTLLGTVLNSDEHLFYLFEPCKGGGDAGKNNCENIVENN
jgi:hypothetical protein